jgi:hypothetical protein
MNCQLCNNEADANGNVLCIYHQESFSNLKAGYEKWMNAFGVLDWETYLRKLVKRPETGNWVKEYCQFLIVKEKQNNKLK